VVTFGTAPTLCTVGSNPTPSAVAVVLTGPPGAGKSAVLTALADALSDDDIPHAAVELEALMWTHPALSGEQWTRHVQAVCALHREAGHELLLIAQTLETDGDMAQLRQAVGAAEYLLVRLEASPATLAARIIDREPESWSGLPELVEHAQQLAASMPALRGVNLVLNTDGQRPETVAQRIREAHPGRLRRPRG
jgi:energy-coupling factor transporter ATP-binding protein EcfA2